MFPEVRLVITVWHPNVNWGWASLYGQQYPTCGSQWTFKLEARGPPLSARWPDPSKGISRYGQPRLWPWRLSRSGRGRGVGFAQEHGPPNSKQCWSPNRALSNQFEDVYAAWCLCQKLSLSLLYFNKTILHKSSEQSSFVTGPRLNSSPLEARIPVSSVVQQQTFILGARPGFFRTRLGCLEL